MQKTKLTGLDILYIPVDKSRDFVRPINKWTYGNKDIKL